MKYTTEKNIQILITLLKAYGIRRVIASPGSTNMSFVGSMMHDDFFEIYSCVDERSAAYMACGMADESGEPVVLSCTGATASRNYMPALTEAFYRKLPVLAITSHHGIESIGKLKPQQIDRTVVPNDIVKISVELSAHQGECDERYCTIQACKAIHALSKNGGGPAHINLITTFPRDYSSGDLIKVTPISFYNTSSENLPKLNGRVAIFVGSHRQFSSAECISIEKFCKCYDAVVFCDKTSGYSGYYAVNASLLLGNDNYKGDIGNVDTLIHIGEVSGDYMTRLKSKCVWRVNEDGEIRDTFNNVVSVFQMSEKSFFDIYIRMVDYTCDREKYLLRCKEEIYKANNMIGELPFSQIWIAKECAQKLPKQSSLHLGILSALRSWNFFDVAPTIKTRCNVGGFGIDGCLSTLIGASLINNNQLYFGVFGDLTFFYDMNSLGIRHIGNNIRIMIINNGVGNEFRIHINKEGSSFGKDVDKYIAAGGHYGNKSRSLVKNYAENLGFDYISASNKSEFLQNVDYFTDGEMHTKSLLFEVFIDADADVKALRTVLNLYETPKPSLRESIRNSIKKTISQKKIDAIHTLLK